MDMKLQRMAANREILNRITEYMDEYPNENFALILHNIGITKEEQPTPWKSIQTIEFNEYSIKTLERMKNKKI